MRRPIAHQWHARAYIDWFLPRALLLDSCMRVPIAQQWHVRAYPELLPCAGGEKKHVCRCSISTWIVHPILTSGSDFLGFEVRSSYLIVVLVLRTYL